MQVIYSAERARILRISLRAVQVLALGMVGLALWLLARVFTEAGTEQQTSLMYALILLLQGGVLLALARWCLRRLPQRGTDARLWCLMTGGLTLLASVPLLRSIIGIAAVFVGLFVLTTALRTDPQEPGSAAGPAQ